MQKEVDLARAMQIELERKPRQEPGPGARTRALTPLPASTGGAENTDAQEPAGEILSGDEPEEQWPETRTTDVLRRDDPDLQELLLHQAEADRNSLEQSRQDVLPKAEARKRSTTPRPWPRVQNDLPDDRKRPSGSGRPHAAGGRTKLLRPLSWPQGVPPGAGRVPGAAPEPCGELEDGPANPKVRRRVAPGAASSALAAFTVFAAQPMGVDGMLIGTAVSAGGVVTVLFCASAGAVAYSMWKAMGAVARGLRWHSSWRIALAGAYQWAMTPKELLELTGAAPEANLAHLPRWIDDPTVDSAAMLHAFLCYKKGASREEREALNLLWCIEHQSSEIVHIGCLAVHPTRVDPPDLRQRQCTQDGCERCAGRQGGYQFRWYDARWFPVYLEARRPDAWPQEARWATGFPWPQVM